MTSTGSVAPAGVVRPFQARVVRQERVSTAVSPMADAQTLDVPVHHRVPADAYAESPTALYVYRMRRGTDDLVGVVADVRLDAFTTGVVRGHESVDPRRVDALVRYYAEEPSRSEPVALLHSFPESASVCVREACRARPLLRFAAADGVEHSLWRVTGNGAIAELTAALGQGVQYIADGHHRVAARISAWEQAGRPSGRGVLCVLFPMDGLGLYAFHRRISGPVDATVLRGAARTWFDVGDVAAAHEARGIGLYLAGRWHDLTFAGERPEGAAGLDVALLQSHLLAPAMGVAGPGDPRLEVVPAHLPLGPVMARCREDGGALFVLRPPSLRRLTAIADRGEVMPPKTTYFAPKPYAGLFLT